MLLYIMLIMVHLYLQPCVSLELFVWLAMITAILGPMGEWSSVLINHGTQFVTSTGIILMQVLCVINWGSLLMVSPN